MQREPKISLRHVVLTVSTALLIGSSPFPGGCGSTVTRPMTYVTETCDTIANGQYTDPACNGDFGSGALNMGAPSSKCPKSAPLDCGTGCCPSAFPWCCTDRNWCGSTSAACLQVDNPGAAPDSGQNSSSGGGGGTSEGGGGGGCGIPAGGCAAAGLVDATLRSGCCSVAQGCPNGGSLGSCTDTCYSWYEVGGQLYGPCSVGDTGCLTQEATSAASACQ